MSTRALIYKIESDNSVKGIYCHFSGQIEAVGQILKESYKNPKKTQELIKLGNISMLAETPEETIAYYRDIDKEQSELESWPTFSNWDEFDQNIRKNNNLIDYIYVMVPYNGYINSKEAKHWTWLCSEYQGNFKEY